MWTAGVTYFPACTNGLFVGIGEFVVFSVFAAHAMKGGVAPLAAVSIAMLCALAATMLHAALQWPKRSLFPVLPSSITLAAGLLALERVAVRPLAEALAASAHTL